MASVREWRPRPAARSSRAAVALAASVSAPDRRRLERLKRRRDFLAAARARRWATPAFVLQARRRGEDEIDAGERPRIGFTASKKVGKAVERNRAKRRLRAVVGASAPERARDGWDYVLIARAGAVLARGFERMRGDLDEAFERVHAPRRQR